MNKREEFSITLSKSNRKDLFDLCKRYIWLSAYAANNQRSDYHWMSDMCYDECYKRKELKIYEDAYRVTFKSEIGRDPYPEKGKIGEY